MRDIAEGNWVFIGNWLVAEDRNPILAICTTCGIHVGRCDPLDRAALPVSSSVLGVFICCVSVLCRRESWSSDALTSPETVQNLPLTHHSPTPSPSPSLSAVTRDPTRSHHSPVLIMFKKTSFLGVSYSFLLLSCSQTEFLVTSLLQNEHNPKGTLKLPCHLHLWWTQQHLNDLRVNMDD